MTLEQFRKCQGLTLAGMADLLGVSGANGGRTVQRWERLERIPSRAKLVEIERATAGAVPAADWPLAPAHASAA